MDHDADEALRDAAASWFARMQGPDADKSRAAFERWLAESPRHRRAWDRMAASWERGRLIADTPTGRAWQGLPPRDRARPRRATWGYAIAASLLVILAVGLLLAHGTPGRAPQVAQQALVSPLGIRKVRLEDGSTVTLDAGARLMLHYTAGERRVALEAGRARFEVAHDAARPFIVVAMEREVVATGTVFDVSIEQGKLSVALLRGGVDVQLARSNAPRAVLAHLVPGETLQIASGDAVPKPGVLSEAAKAWPSGMVEFDGTPLRDVIATANLHSTRRLALADPALGDLRVTGAYRLGDPDALAAGLAAAFGLRVARRSDGAVLLAR
ncbi:MAG TPA: FecR domain-containing protein [Sphingomonas sp.]|nr:FecR domain-containing protein [Sphingomonas sp.]